MNATSASTDHRIGRPGFAVIPVLDLRGGRVVRARRGERSSYAPIETPLAKGSAPDAVARGLLNAWPATLLYVADLDAIIDGAAPDLRALESIARACPGVGLWVDAGFAAAAGVEAFLAAGLGRPVIGSESQSDPGLVRRLGDRAVFSLDTRGAERLGPAALHDDPSLWPPEVIAMTLAQVGAGAGPDVATLGALRVRAPDRRLYAAGGVRGPDDLRALRDAGLAGALVASALHDGTLSRAAAPDLA
ncbi:1-(5-phosphoribosyl)-5-[(5-phosphoribosylamino) methylideneamino] imidazole-4-carboxamide isomerase [Methylobacterium tardum]|uniref:Nickel transporter n=1 Tax=Methylobacterium tardum TaxID=374432 RepID=A0AA37TGX4_9HYPH|nr:HisA/HisF-related TIM barrel protein [Methylobacterium tardum]URD37695.1 HisA/HisF-related TIM barrel protein [Methylobacterium tardum]GJE52236.1 1-(5-phosphoribosyl)-5-[(5-phosphoribosylamino) methylideneamino] imidazole-4-carboxamide isomerase [Methylobacterium tardum]GLS73430.1 nickel transporter [Methylobacterium tardum]